MRKFQSLIASLLALVLLGGVASAQNITVKGNVTDKATGEPVSFASIQIKGTMQGASTDLDGNFSIDAPKNGTLIFSFVGYKTEEVEIAGRSQINVVLESEAESLDDVVVVAYGTAKKESVTGALATVKSEAIESRPVTSVTDVLAGMSAGVMVNEAGDPGDDASIRIRGFGSVTGSNSPLYVIDGVPFGGNISDLNPNDIENITVLKDATSAALYGNRASNGVILITTRRGKSDKVGLNVSVNQGFYNRAIPEYDRVDAKQFMQIFFTGVVNGLQNGTSPKTKAEAIANTRSNLFTYLGQYNIFDVANADLFDADGVFNADANIRAGYDDLNWHDAVMHVGYRQDYNVNGSGASDKSNYFFSMGYLNDQGQTINSGFERWTGRANISVTPRKWLKAGINLSASLQERDYRSDGTAYANPIYQASIMAPIYPIYLHDNTTGEYLLDSDGNKQYDGGELYNRMQWPSRHSIWEAELDLRHIKRITTDAQVFADIKFLKDFTLSIKGDLNLRNSKDRTYNNAIIGDGYGNHGRASRTEYLYTNWTFQQLLNYNKEIGDHSIEALLGHEFYSYRYDYQYGYKTNQTFANKYELVNFTDITSYTGYYANYAQDSYLSRVKYNYQNKYFGEASYRLDASSKFHPQSRWGSFWSVGGTWVLSREDFIKQYSWIDNLRLRASYGQVGNDGGIGYYAYMGLYTVSEKYGGMTAAYKSQNESLELVWESENAFSTALEGRLFDRTNFTLEFFNKTTQDLLFEVPAPFSQGGTGHGSSSTGATTTKNIGSVRNRGIEITLDHDIIKTKDFSWNFGVNATMMKNTILKLPEADGTNYDGLQNAIVSGTKLRAEGHGIYDYWLYQWVGVDQMTGNSLYEIDANKYYILDENKIGDRWDEETKTMIHDYEKGLVPAQYAVVIDGKEYVKSTTYAKQWWSGSSLPKVYGSFNTALRFKNFSLSALFTYALGGKCIDYAYQSLISVSQGSPHAYHVDLLKSWSDIPDGMTEDSANRIDPNGIPRIDSYWNSYSNATSTRSLISGNYLVVKNINLSYRLPKKVVSKLDVSSITFNASIENLWSFTARKGLNPQQSFNGAVYGYNINTPRVGTVGVKVNF